MPCRAVDMRQRDHNRALSATSGATAMCPQIARADGHNLAHKIDGKRCSVFFNELNLTVFGSQRTPWPFLTLPAPP